MRRGRPRHDDVLTPREWQVLDLLREGLTNEQIAARLGISYDTAKFHVSEILGKLEVQTREEAAAWLGRPRMVPVLAPLGALFARFETFSPWRLAAMALLSGAVVLLLVLGLGVALTNSRSPDEDPREAVEAHTGVEELDLIIDSLLNADVTALAGQFSVEAREGGLIGGPIGLYDPEALTSAEWTARLGAAQRSLHAVVRDPEEPFEWWDQVPPGPPRAAVLDAKRDFDIVLIVAASPETASAWRFSVLNSDLIDVVIDSGLGPDGAPTSVPLIRRLAYLTPSPDDEPASFLVLPREDMRPPPVTSGPGSGPGGGPEPPPAPVDAPTFAPDGRTGDPALDALIESLLGEDAATLAARFASLTGSQQVCDPRCTETRVSLADWTARLASGDRSLYAVYTGDPAEAELMLAVDNTGQFAEAWRFRVQSGRLSALNIFVAPDPPLPWMQGQYAFPRDYTPSPSREYERFYVLPPQSELPKAPTYHPLSVRTGQEGIDALLARLEAGDAHGLTDLFASTDSMLVHHCGNLGTMEGAAYLETWASEVTAQVVGVNAVARLPEGYPVEADHVLIAVVRLNPFSWHVRGFFEAEGEVVGLVTTWVTTEQCSPDRLYPPESFLLPPPDGGAEGLDPSRRSGLAAIDAFLDAVHAGDEAALDGMIDYSMLECVAQMDDGSLPGCPPGVALGTPIEGIHTGACGVSSPRAEAPARLIRWLADASIYAVTSGDSASQAFGTPDRAIAVLARPLTTQPRPGGPIRPVALALARLSVAGDRITVIEGSSCGAYDVLWLLQGEPDFLLPPQ